MAWLEIGKDGEEYLVNDDFHPFNLDAVCPNVKKMAISLPRGTIKALIGRTLSFGDSPVEINKKNIIVMGLL